jgi:DNA-binding SARP family transcriptional activator
MDSVLISNDMDGVVLARCVATPIVICLLGNFRLLKEGQPVLRRSSKAGPLLGTLALLPRKRASRPFLLETLWPGDDVELAGQSLNSLVHNLRKLLGDVIGGESPVLVDGDSYRLNVDAGIAIDVTQFDQEVDEGERNVQSGDWMHALQHYTNALAVYKGDLLADGYADVEIERERLRGRYLSVLNQLADHSFHEGHYSLCLNQAHRMLASDPCREDAHRLIMRCYVRRNERAQALRQFVLCRDVLKAQFDAQPEPDTLALYEQIRLDPSKV